VRLLTQQFFLSLAEQLRALQPEPLLPTIAGAFDEQDYDIAPASPALERRDDMLHALVRRLRLGQGDPRAEERWVRTIRRGSFAGALLLLVWMGTRLPRRE
jgi:hypothetical protein